MANITIDLTEEEYEYVSREAEKRGRSIKEQIEHIIHIKKEVDKRQPPLIRIERNN